MNDTYTPCIEFGEWQVNNLAYNLHENPTLSFRDGFAQGVKYVKEVAAPVTAQPPQLPSEVKSVMRELVAQLTPHESDDVAEAQLALIWKATELMKRLG